VAVRWQCRRQAGGSEQCSRSRQAGRTNPRRAGPRSAVGENARQKEPIRRVVPVQCRCGSGSSRKEKWQAEAVEESGAVGSAGGAGRKPGRQQRAGAETVQEPESGSRRAVKKESRWKSRECRQVAKQVSEIQPRQRERVRRGPRVERRVV